MKCCYNLYIHKENEFSSNFLFVIDRDEKIVNYQSNFNSSELTKLLKSAMPYVATQEGLFGIGVNKFVTTNNTLISKYEFIDTRLLGIEEFYKLLKGVIKETITEEQFTLYKKHLAVKALID